MTQLAPHLPEAIPLPQVLSTIVIPALGQLPAHMGTPEARVMLLAIGLQESRFRDRVQRPLRPGMRPGPARGFWQFERGGGVAGVLTHSATRTMAEHALARRDIPNDTRAAWDMLAKDDQLAAVFARLLLFTDPSPLPRIGDDRGAWMYYIRNWRPGKPHPQTWRALYDSAVNTCRGA